MYCSHFNLKKKPFQLSSDNSFLWLGETHARALDLLKRGIDGPEKLLVLTGDIGTGKTTLIHELRHSLSQTTAVAHISDPSIELNYLYLSIARGMGFDDLYRTGENFDPVLWAFLSRQRQAQKRCLIIIDEAHLIPEQFLAHLPSWVKFAPDATLTILLAGQLELHQVMEKTLGCSWEAKVDIHAMLSPLKETQTRDYIDRRLELAGATHKIFIPGAVREVHGYAKGIPRRINIACDQAMIAACSNEMQTVDARIFRKAVGILELPAPPVGFSPAPASQTPPVIQRSRRPGNILSVLAAAVLLAVFAYTFYLPNPFEPDKITNVPITKQAGQTGSVVVQAIVPPPAAQAVQGVLTGADVQQESSQPALQAPSAPSDIKNAHSGRSVDMDAFINEVFMMHKSDSIHRVSAPSDRLAASGAPGLERPVSSPAGPSASLSGEPDPVRVLTVQPDSDAIIDWLIEEKKR